jgi:hypothetical protein
MAWSTGFLLRDNPFVKIKKTISWASRRRQEKIEQSAAMLPGLFLGQNVL